MRPLRLLPLLLAGCAAAAEAPVVRTGHVAAGDGTTIVYDQRGQGEVAVLFIHCWCGNRRFWQSTADALPDYSVVTLDLPGHGDSGRGRKHWSLAGLGNDVVAVADALHLQRVILVGHSMGGPVALEAARRLRGRVLGVVAVDTLQSAEPDWSAQQFARMSAAFAADFDGTLDQMLSGMFPAGTDPAIVRWTRAQALAADRTAAVELMRDFPSLDLPALFSGAGAPIRAINNAPPPDGQGLPTATGINRKYADFDATLLHDCGHFPMLTRPAEFQAALRQALAELARPDQPRNTRDRASAPR